MQIIPLETKDNGLKEAARVLWARRFIHLFGTRDYWNNSFIAPDLTHLNTIWPRPIGRASAAF